MNPTQRRALDILGDLGRRPAAPFHEDDPAAYITRCLSDIGLSPTPDAFGNVIAHYDNAPSDDPPIAFVAHMDHPGFEIDVIDDDGPTGVALGGVPESSLIRPADVVALLPDGRRVRGRTVPFTPENRRVRFEFDEPIPFASAALPIPVVFDLPDFELDGDFIRMRAADDLAGCAASLAARGAPRRRRRRSQRLRRLHSRRGGRAVRRAPDGRSADAAHRDAGRFHRVQPRSSPASSRAQAPSSEPATPSTPSTPTPSRPSS